MSLSSPSTALIALTAGGTVSQFLGQRQAASAAQAQASYQAAIYRNDADVADQQAADALARGGEAELRQRQQTRGLVGAQRAALAAQGIELDQGTALDLQTQAASMGELDALTIRNNAAREAYGYQQQALDLRQRAMLTSFAGANAAAADQRQAFGTLLTGAAKTYGIVQRQRS